MCDREIARLTWPMNTVIYNVRATSVINKVTAQSEVRIVILVVKNISKITSVNRSF